MRIITRQMPGSMPSRRRSSFHGPSTCVSRTSVTTQPHTSESAVASPAPVASMWKPATKVRSSTMFTTQVDATMIDGERVSPTERCTAEPVL